MRDGRTDGRTDRQTDGVKPIYPKWVWWDRKPNTIVLNDENLNLTMTLVCDIQTLFVTSVAKGATNKSRGGGGGGGVIFAMEKMKIIQWDRKFVIYFDHMRYA